MLFSDVVGTLAGMSWADASELPASPSSVHPPANAGPTARAQTETRAAAAVRMLADRRDCAKFNIADFRSRRVDRRRLASAKCLRRDEDLLRRSCCPYVHLMSAGASEMRKGVYANFQSHPPQSRGAALGRGRHLRCIRAPMPHQLRTTSGTRRPRMRRCRLQRSVCPAARPSKTSRSRLLCVNAAARSKATRASAWRPRRESRSPCTLASQW